MTPNFNLPPGCLSKDISPLEFCSHCDEEATHFPDDKEPMCDFHYDRWKQLEEEQNEE